MLFELNRGAADLRGNQVACFNETNVGLGITPRERNNTVYVTTRAADRYLVFEILDRTPSCTLTDSNASPLCWNPHSWVQNRIAAVCVKCGYPFEGRHTPIPAQQHYDGTEWCPETPAGERDRKAGGRAYLWISLQVFEDGLSFKPDARQWIGFAPGARCNPHLAPRDRYRLALMHCFNNVQYYWPRQFARIQKPLPRLAYEDVYMHARGGAPGEEPGGYGIFSKTEIVVGLKLEEFIMSRLIGILNANDRTVESWDPWVVRSPSGYYALLPVQPPQATVYL